MPTSLPLSNVLTTPPNSNSSTAKAANASPVKSKMPSDISDFERNKANQVSAHEIKKSSSSIVEERPLDRGDGVEHEAFSFKRSMQAADKEISPKNDLKKEPVADALVPEQPIAIEGIANFVQFHGQWSTPVVANNSSSQHWSLLSQLSGVEPETLESDLAGNIVLAAPVVDESEVLLSDNTADDGLLFFNLASPKSETTTELNFAVSTGENPGEEALALNEFMPVSSDTGEVDANTTLVADVATDLPPLTVTTPAVTNSDRSLKNNNSITAQDTPDFIEGRLAANSIISSVESTPALAAKVEPSETTVGKLSTLIDGIEPSMKATNPSIKVDVLTTQVLPLAEQAASPAVKDANAFQQVLASTGGLSGNALELSFDAKNTVPLNVAFGQASWSASLAERTAWMVGKSIQTAEIQLDPPELGSLHIKIHMHQDQASVNFVSANPQVRDAVEQSLGRLRELLQDRGLELVDSGVADQRSGKRQDPDAANTTAITGRESEGLGITQEADLHSIVVTMPWSVDYYA